MVEPSHLHGYRTLTVHRLSPASRTQALYMLCHVCLDDRVCVNSDILISIQDAIEKLLCTFADSREIVSSVRYLHHTIPPTANVLQLSDVIPKLTSRVLHPTLQRNLVCALPAGSPLTAHLQRYLALSFFMHPTTIDVAFSDPKLPRIVHDHLSNSSHFRVNKNTDYGHLASRLTLLDIAIGPGFLTVPYQPLLSPATSDDGSSPLSAPTPVSSEVKKFNEEIDALVQHVKLLGNSIVEVGAAVDLTILDAKDCIERLCSRLENAVRIGGKKIHDVFGDDGDKQLRVNKFFIKTKRENSIPKTSGIFDEDDQPPSN